MFMLFEKTNITWSYKNNDPLNISIHESALDINDVWHILLTNVLGLSLQQPLKVVRVFHLNASTREYTYWTIILFK